MFSQLQFLLFLLVLFNYNNSALELLTRVAGNDLGDLRSEAAQLLLQRRGSVQRRHARLPQTLHPLPLPPEVRHGRVPVQNEERRGPPLVFQGPRVASAENGGYF